MGHTWKDTYLYNENGCYKEYGTITLSEAQFLQYDNAAKILSDIRNESGSIDSKNDGRMGTSFSLLEATYPKELPGGSS